MMFSCVMYIVPIMTNGIYGYTSIVIYFHSVVRNFYFVQSSYYIATKIPEN